jgi:hypothetical protein
MPNLNSVRQQVKAIIDYNWEKEAENYAKMLAEGEDIEKHVFVSMMQVSNVLNSTNTDPEMWAFEQFSEFFDAMYDEGDTCLKCGNGTFDLVKATSLHDDHLKCSACEMLAILGKGGH